MNRQRFYAPTKYRIFIMQIYHPNIDLDGNVCLNILREDWKPVLSIHSILIGVLYLFQEPNPDDPLNKGYLNFNIDAAAHLKSNKSSFQSAVSASMAGNAVAGIKFDRVV
jgi:ubiquitin-conjugating enzyme E2 M